VDYLYQDAAIFNQRIMGPAHIENIVHLACRAALSNRAVSHIGLPIDIQVQPVESGRRFKRNVPGHASRSYQPPGRIAQRPLIESAAALFEGKRRIAILAGQGARGAGAELRGHRARPESDPSAGSATATAAARGRQNRTRRWCGTRRRKVAKHFELSITDTSLSFTRNQAAIDTEAALDGFYVLRTNVSVDALSAPDTVRAYKRLAGARRFVNPVSATEH
jgi:hypothetical protein